MIEYAVIDPASGEHLRRYPTATDEEIAAAVAAAAARRPLGPDEQRCGAATLVRRVGALHTERRDDLGRIIVREMGKPLDEALAEVDFAAAILRLLRRSRRGVAGRRTCRPA